MTKWETGIIETMDREIFDTAFLDKKHVQFFQVPRGGGKKGKTLAETNMSMSGVLPAPERITLTHRPRVQVYSDEGMVPLNQAIWMDSLFLFHVNSQIYFQGPLYLFAHPSAVIHGVNPNFFSAEERQRLLDSVTNPLGQQQIEINPLDPFRAEIEVKIPTLYKAKVSLKGDYGRAI